MHWNRAWNLPLLVTAGAIMFLTNLGGTHLWDVDEAIFSETAREMHERGDLIVPYFNGKLFSHKPPVMYWFQISAYQVFGQTEFAARLWSALFGIGSMILTYHLGRILFGVRAGLWGGLILGSCVNFTVISRAATPDSYLVFFCTLALLALVAGSHRPVGGESADAPWQPTLPPSWRTYALAYAIMGVAVMVKGPVGVVLPTAVWGLFLLFEHRFAGWDQRLSGRAGPPAVSSEQGWWAGARKLAGPTLLTFHPTHILNTIWRMRPLTAVAAVLLVAGPWYAWVGIRTDGEFLREFFGVHNFGRFSSAMDNHRGPIYYYLVALLAGSFPWCVLLAPCLIHVVQSIRRKQPTRSSLVLLASWVAVWVGFFTLAGTKLPSYIVPAYPAVALLFAALVDKWHGEIAGNCRAWLRVCWGVAGVIGVAILWVVPMLTKTHFAGEIAPALVGLSLVVGAIAGLALSETGRVRGSLATLGATAVVFCTWIMAYSVIPIDAHQTSAPLAESVRLRTAGESPALGSYCFCPPSLVFYGRSPIETLDSRYDVAAHFAAHGQDAFVVTIEERLKELESELPADVVVLERRRRFGKLGHIVLLGRDDNSRTARAAMNSATRPVTSAQRPRPTSR